MADFVKKRSKPYPALLELQEQKILQGKTAVITGASRGIGREIVAALARAGVTHLGITGRSTKNLEETASIVKQQVSSAVISIQTVDASDETSVDGSINKFWDAFPGGIDILIHNAGIMEPCLPIAESKVEDWWKTQEVNVKGPYLSTHAFLKRHLAANDSKQRDILYTSSIGALFTSPTLSSYQMSKTSVSRLAEFVHAEYSDKRIRVFAFHPGGIMTDMGYQVPESIRKTLQDEVTLPGAFVVYLASAKSNYLAGRYVSANWDIEELEARQKEIIDKDLLKFVVSM